MIEMLKQYFKGTGSALLVMAVMYGGVWLKKIFAQKKRNDINEIDLMGEKISLDNSAKSLDKLVSDSNAKHGVNEVVGQAGSDDKKGK